jgi:methylphosphotriester-DNA--protein-cysteine methyltransferase
MLPDADELYASLVARDGRYEGMFVCVRTTGIFCRMTCLARTPLQKNVEFRVSASDCLAAGFRACKRCRPDQAGSPLAGSSSAMVS